MASVDYAIPFQGISLILLGPGSTVSHDVLRLLARHGTGLAAVGDDGVRAYTAMPLGPDDSALARRHARPWADADDTRLSPARRLYAGRLGEVLPHRALDVLRGIQGPRPTETYRMLAQHTRAPWQGRAPDRTPGPGGTGGE